MRKDVSDTPSDPRKLSHRNGLSNDMNDHLIKKICAARMHAFAEECCMQGKHSICCQVAPLVEGAASDTMTSNQRDLSPPVPSRMTCIVMHACEKKSFVQAKHRICPQVALLVDRAASGAKSSDLPHTPHPSPSSDDMHASQTECCIQGKHTIRYEDGDVEQLNLFQESWHLVQAPAVGSPSLQIKHLPQLQPQPNPNLPAAGQTPDPTNKPLNDPQPGTTAPNGDHTPPIVISGTPGTKIRISLKGARNAQNGSHPHDDQREAGRCGSAGVAAGVAADLAPASKCGSHGIKSDLPGPPVAGAVAGAVADKAGDTQAAHTMEWTPASVVPLHANPAMGDNVLEGGRWQHATVSVGSKQDAPEAALGMEEGIEPQAAIRTCTGAAQTSALSQDNVN